MSDNKGKKMSMNSNIGSSPTKGDQGMQSPNQGNLNQASPVNMPKFSEDEVLSLDNDLVELRQKYIEAKKNRKIVEVNEKNIQNKMELLSSKEVEAQKRLQVSNQNQKDREDLKEDNKKQKERLEELKKKNEELLKQKRDKVNAQKNRTKVILSGWRMKNAEKKKGEGNKKFNEKKDIEKAVQQEKEKVNNRNKYLHDQVKMNFIQLEQKKKAEELEKKLKRKKELEDLINEEINKRKELQEKIDDYNAKSVQINEKIKEMDSMTSQQFAQVNSELQKTQNMPKPAKSPSGTRGNLSKTSQSKKLIHTKSNKNSSMKKAAVKSP